MLDEILLQLCVSAQGSMRVLGWESSSQSPSAWGNGWWSPPHTAPAVPRRPLCPWT